MAWLAKQTAMLRSHPLAVSAFVAILCIGCSYGLKYWVGDSAWCVPPYASFYSDWSSSHLFRVGDSLVFDFETESYALIQVTALDYRSCSGNNPVRVLTAGPATVKLNEQGVFYYLCNISNYCDLGQKISVAVHNHNPPSASPSLAPFGSSLAPSSVPSPSTDYCNVPAHPVHAPVTDGRAPTAAPKDLGDAKSYSSSRLESLGSCISRLPIAVLFVLLSQL